MSFESCPQASLRIFPSPKASGNTKNSLKREKAIYDDSNLASLGASFYYLPDPIHGVKLRIFPSPTAYMGEELGIFISPRAYTEETVRRVKPRTSLRSVLCQQPVFEGRGSLYFFKSQSLYRGGEIGIFPSPRA